MKTVYALQFDIYPSVNTRICLGEIQNLITDWVQKKYRLTWNTDLVLGFQDKSFSPLSQHMIVISKQESDDFLYVFFEWTHPDDQDQSLYWKTTCSFSADNEKIEASIVIRIESAQFVVKPIIGYNVGKPRIIEEILTRYCSKISTEKIPVSYQEIYAGEVGLFVSEVLENANRVLPVILLSRDAWTNLTFVDPVALQKKLLGFARVVVIDKDAGFELTGILGKQLSCYNGAIRIYWSGFTKTANPFFHQLFLQDKMLSYQNEGLYIETHLFRLLASIAALRYAEGKLTKKVLQHLQNKRFEEVARIRQELQEKRITIDEFFPEFEKALDENEQLQIELRAKTARIQELESEIANHRENYLLLSAYHGEMEPVQSEEIREVVSEFASVLDAINKANELFGEYLIIWESARESAARSGFARPKEIFEAIKAIYELGEKYFKSLKTGESIGAWEQFFASKGFKYAPTESEMTINLYGNERRFSHKGERKQMLRHLTLGGGDRTNCVQIYFEPNEGKEKIEIGYCGLHLRYYSQ